ncbi:MAG: hypothetical protein ACRYFU_16335 [Janthinobacterium lividum]
MPIRCLALCSSLSLVLLLGGCRSAPRQVGADLPVVPADSRALPGSVNSADAPESPRVQTDRRDVTSFRDAETGISFDYPSPWRPLVLGGPMYAPSFTEKLGPAKGTQALLPAGTAFAKTNLVGISFAWTVKQKMSADACDRASVAVLSAGKPAPPETIHGLRFSRASGGDGSTCHQRMSILDTTRHAGKCYVFERDLETMCPGITTAGNDLVLSPAQKTELQTQLDQIMASVTLE